LEKRITSGCEQERRIQRRDKTSASEDVLADKTTEIKRVGMDIQRGGMNYQGEQSS